MIESGVEVLSITGMDIFSEFEFSTTVVSSLTNPLLSDLLQEKKMETRITKHERLNKKIDFNVILIIWKLAIILSF